MHPCNIIKTKNNLDPTLATVVSLDMSALVKNENFLNEDFEPIDLVSEEDPIYCEIMTVRKAVELHFIWIYPSQENEILNWDETTIVSRTLRNFRKHYQTFLKDRNPLGRIGHYHNADDSETITFDIGI